MPLPDALQTTLVPLSSEASSAAQLSWLLIGGATVLFVVVMGLAWMAIRSRPPWLAGERAVIAGGVVVPIVLLTLLLVYTTYQGAALARDGAAALRVEVIGHQWWWRVRYLDANGSLDFETANEIRLPVGQRVELALRSADVLHSFWVPNLAGKLDMIPGRTNRLTVTPQVAAIARGQCAEYCGDSHAVMRFRIIALEPKEFAEWLEQQTQLARNVTPRAADANRPTPQFASLRTFHQNEAGITEKFDVNPLEAWRAKQLPEKNEDAALIAQGKTLFASKACSTCHTVRGHQAMGVQGPDLTHVGSRSTIAAGLIENNSDQLRRWIRDPGSVKPGNKMAKAYNDLKITLSNEEQAALVAYLESLK